MCHSNPPSSGLLLYILDVVLRHCHQWSNATTLAASAFAQLSPGGGVLTLTLPTAQVGGAGLRPGRGAGFAREAADWT